MSPTVLAPGDLFFTRSPTWLGWAIRLFTRSPGESRTRVNHVGVVVRGGLLSEAVVVEALHHVVKRRLMAAYGPPRRTPVAIYRLKGLSQDERAAIARKSESYVGRKYGYLKIGAHLGDWLLGRLAGREVYAFRRLAKMDRYPTCDWLAAHVYPEWFSDAPSPDGIWDAVYGDLLHWSCVRPLWPL